MEIFLILIVVVVTQHVCHGFIVYEIYFNKAGLGGKKMSQNNKAKSLQMVTAAMKLKDTCSLEEKLWPT